MTSTDWIAFTEREPEAGQKVLVTNGTHVIFCEYKESLLPHCWTHWMPFTPPKERDEFEEWWNSRHIADLALSAQDLSRATWFAARRRYGGKG